MQLLNFLGVTDVGITARVCTSEAATQKGHLNFFKERAREFLMEKFLVSVCWKDPKSSIRGLEGGRRNRTA
jgi:hypothetical protein